MAQEQVWHRQEYLGSVRLSRPLARALLARLGKTFSSIISFVSISSWRSHDRSPRGLSLMQTVGKQTLPSVSERSSTTVAFTTHLVGSHLAVKVLVVYHGTSSELVTTSSLSHGKCGRLTPATDRESMTKMARW